jgi:hypothetical protein
MTELTQFPQLSTYYMRTYTALINVTLSIDDQVVSRARKKAHALGKSLNQLIRDYLQELAGGDDPEQSIEEFRRLSAKGTCTAGALTATRFMSARSFFDSHVLVFTDDRASLAKQRRALDLLAEHRRAGTGVVSLQVLQEYFVTVTRKLPSFTLTRGLHAGKSSCLPSLMLLYRMLPTFWQLLTSTVCTGFPFGTL